MLVRELVALLSQLDQDAPVELSYDGGYGGGPLWAGCVYESRGRVVFSGDAAHDGEPYNDE